MISLSVASLLGVALADEISIGSDGSQQPTKRTSLERARMLDVPVAVHVQNAEYEHAIFWDENGALLHSAWEEWEQSSLSWMSNDNEFVNPSLSHAIDAAFANPTVENEDAVRSLWSSSFGEDERLKSLPKGVYSTQLLTPSGIVVIRSILDQAAASGIPKRRPNGMNRNGFILDRYVNGAVPISSLMDLIENVIIARIVRPVGRMFFREYIGCHDDIEYFAFTIRYDGDQDSINNMRDVKLNEHRDASVITLNVNLNLPDENYSGSDLFFSEFPHQDSTFDTVNTTSFVKFTPGMAVIHLGAHRHGSIAILPDENNVNTSATRYNLVIWLFGEDGDVRIAPYSKEEQMNVVERWHGCGSVRGMISSIHNFV